MSLRDYQFFLVPNHRILINKGLKININRFSTGSSHEGVKNSMKKRQQNILEIQLSFQRETNKKIFKREIEKGETELKSKMQNVN